MKKQTLIPDSKPVLKQNEQNNIPKSSNFIDKGMKKPETIVKHDISRPSLVEPSSTNKFQIQTPIQINKNPENKPFQLKMPTPNKKNINEAELEEARESLRLLKMKMDLLVLFLI